MTETPNVTRVEVYKDAAGDFRWRGRAGNGRIVAESGEGYSHRVDCSAAAASLFPDAWTEHLPETETDGGR